MALHCKRWDIKPLFYPTTEVGRKDKWLVQDPGPVYGKFSVHETHRVAHLVLIMFTEGVKDTVTLLLFYLVVIWECSVLPVGNVFFSRRFRDDPAAVQGRRRIAASPWNAASCRREEAQGRRSVAAVRGRAAFKVCTLWMRESVNLNKQSNQQKISKYTQHWPNHHLWNHDEVSSD